MRTLVTWISLALAAQAWGDSGGVVYLDMNYSPKEVAAAQDEAKKEGRQFLSCPVGNTDDVTACLKKAQTQGISNVSSLYISGHHADGAFLGVNSLGESVSDKDLKASIAAFPSYRDSIKSVHLNGCYTALPGALNFGWKTVLPNVAEVDGFEKKGPSNENAASRRYIEWSMSKEGWLATASPQEVQAAIRGDKSLKVTTLAVCQKNDHISSQKIISDDVLRKTCGNPETAKELAAEYEHVKCFEEAQIDKCANPDDKDDGVIRNLYAKLQAVDVCSELDPGLAEKYKGLPKSLKMLYLIKFPEVKHNFLRAFAPELAKLQASLSKLPEARDIHLGEVEKMNRKQTLELITRIESMNSKITNTADKSQMSKITGLMWRYLTRLDPGCIPTGWISNNVNLTGKCL